MFFIVGLGKRRPINRINNNLFHGEYLSQANGVFQFLSLRVEKNMNIGSDINVLVFGKTGAGPEIFLGYTSQVDKSDFFCHERIILKFISGIPDEEKNKLVARYNRGKLDVPRVFAKIILEKMKANTVFGPYLNPETHPTAESYLPFFSRYMNADRETFKSEFIKDDYLTFIIDLQEFKREYEPISIENNASKATYAMNQASFINAGVQMSPTKLLDTEWDYKPLLSSKLKNASSRNGEIPIGKKTYFLYPAAAKKLFFYTEDFLKKIGFDVIVLKADTMSLAVKVYGPWGYYPTYWNKPGEKEINNDGNIIVSGSKIGSLESKIRSKNNRKRLLTCDNTSGPMMFKFINTRYVAKELIPKLKYEWLNEEIMCKNPFLKNADTRENFKNKNGQTTRKSSYGTFSLPPKAPNFPLLPLPYGPTEENFVGGRRTRRQRKQRK